MKKILVLFVITLVLFTGCSNKNLKENAEKTMKEEKIKNEGKYDVTLYLFYSNGCKHCQEFNEWIDNDYIKEQFPYLNVVKYEVSKYYNLYVKTNLALETNDESVPFIVIGSDYKIGFSQFMINDYKSFIRESSTRQLCDLVDTLKKNGDSSSCMKNNQNN